MTKPTILSERRFVQFGLVGVMLLLLLAMTTPRIDAQGGQWQAKYWNNRTMSGNPVLTRQEQNIDYDWAGGSPANEVYLDNFSAEWKKTASFPAGTYRFSATTDDGMRVFVDNVVVIDSWYDSQVHTVTADVYLTAGSHTITVQYYEAGGKAVAKLGYALITSPTPIPQPPTDSWRGEYFNNTNLSGTPAFVRNDNVINFTWGYGSPMGGIQADNFSVRWTRNVAFEQGKYRFTAVADDGIRVWVNGTMIIDQWKIEAATTHTAEIDMSAGVAQVRVEYFEQTQLAEARLSWTKLSGPVTPPVNAWRAEYYNNISLSGAPTLVRDEAAINYNWGTAAPAPQVNADNFSVRWTRTIPTQAGRYRFTAVTDDGVRIFVNDRLIIDAWADQPSTTYTADVDLAAGSAAVRVEYYERTNIAEIRVTYNLVGGTGGQYPGIATVNTGRLNVRSGPAATYPIVAKLNNRQVVALTGYRNAAATWVQIVTPTGGTGWVNAGYVITSVPVSGLTPTSGPIPLPPPVQPPVQPSGATGTVTAAYLNVRIGPGVGYPALSAVTYGTTLRLIGRDATATWVKLILPDGRQGWASAYYINPTVSISTLPVYSQ